MYRLDNSNHTKTNHPPPPFQPQEQIDHYVHRVGYIQDNGVLDPIHSAARSNQEQSQAPKLLQASPHLILRPG